MTAPTTRRWWPQSLAGQMALVVALALLAAQLVNGALILRERRALLLEQVAGPAVARLVDTADRLARGRPIDERSRVRTSARDPVDPATMPREPAVERAVADGLAEAGVAVRRVHTGIRPFPPGELPERLRSPQARRWGPPAQIVIAVERARGGWLVQRAFWPQDEAALIWHLVAQTAILYAAMLLPVLWITRRIARPLRELATAALDFGRGDAAPPPTPHGPRDVARLIAAFGALRLRVGAMLEEKDRMLGAIGHDLRTPLAALRVRVEGVEDAGDRARMVQIIAEMDQTLDDILSLARIGRAGEPPIEVDLPALVDAVAEDFRDLGHAIGFVAPPRLTVRLRPGLMRRAVRNLLENAVKHGRDAAVTIAPGAGTVAPGAGTVAIVVADRGPGIPPARLAEVFEAFTRIEESRNRDTGGIGLGLALARAIVEDAGGTIALANRTGGGLLATITLPHLASPGAR